MLLLSQLLAHDRGDRASRVIGGRKSLDQLSHHVAHRVGVPFKDGSVPFVKERHDGGAVAQFLSMLLEPLKVPEWKYVCLVQNLPDEPVRLKRLASYPQEDSMVGARRQYSAEQNIAVLRRHLLEQVSVTDTEG